MLFIDERAEEKDDVEGRKRRDLIKKVKKRIKVKSLSAHERSRCHCDLAVSLDEGPRGHTEELDGRRKVDGTGPEDLARWVGSFDRDHLSWKQRVFLVHSVHCQSASDVSSCVHALEHDVVVAELLRGVWLLEREGF